MVDIKEIANVFNFLRLPGELRNRVYRYLLSAGYASASPSSLGYSLEPAILRVNRQIHKEAWSTLYEDNRWIVVKANWKSHDLDDWLQSLGYHRHTLDLTALIKEPALKIEARFKYPDGETAVERISAFVYTPSLLAEICRWLWKEAAKYELTLKLTLGSHPKSSRKNMQNRLLNPFCDTRGVYKALVKGATSEAAGRALEKLMESQLSTWEEVLGTLAGFKKSGDNAFRAGELEAAYYEYRYGIRYIKDCEEISWKYLEGRGGIWTNRFEALGGEISNNKSLICVKLGGFDEAVEAANNALLFPGITDIHRARAHYRRGLAYVGLGQDEYAAKDFYYARDLLPKDPAINEQLRAVGKRLVRTITEEDAPIHRTTFLYGNIREWRGDPRLVEDWGRSALSLLEQLRMR